MRIRDYIRLWWNPSKSWKYKNVQVVSSMSEVPESDLGKAIYLVVKDGTPRWAVLTCPKGHGRRIEVNLMRSIEPFWKADFKNGKLSLFPSVWVTDSSCDCHFWLRQNEAHEALWEL